MQLIAERIENMKPYSVFSIEDGEIKLDAQENPYELPQSLKIKINSKISNLPLNRYPDSECPKLKSLIAAYAGIKLEQILLGNGSDELILSIIMATGGKDSSVTAVAPTFAMYGILAEVLGADFKSVPLLGGWTLPVDDILKVGGKVIFITYPNNPTGNCFSREAIEEIIKKSNALVVLDEAYYEFSGETFANEIAQYKNLVILRTFSKAFSLAGIRAGYLIACEQLIKELRKVQLPYNFNIINQKILEVVLTEREMALVSVKKLIKLREKLFKELTLLKGIEPFPSKANFILMKLDQKEKFLKTLKKNNIRVREFSDPEMKDFMRVTIGTEKENRHFISAIKEAL